MLNGLHCHQELLGVQCSLSGQEELGGIELQTCSTSKATAASIHNTKMMTVSNNRACMVGAFLLQPFKLLSLKPPCQCVGGDLDPEYPSQSYFTGKFDNGGKKRIGQFRLINHFVLHIQYCSEVLTAATAKPILLPRC